MRRETSTRAGADRCPPVQTELKHLHMKRPTGIKLIQTQGNRLRGFDLAVIVDVF